MTANPFDVDPLAAYRTTSSTATASNLPKEAKYWLNIGLVNPQNENFDSFGGFPIDSLIDPKAKTTNPLQKAMQSILAKEVKDLEQGQAKVLEIKFSVQIRHATSKELLQEDKALDIINNYL